MTKNCDILIIDDEKDLGEGLAKLFADIGYAVRHLSDSRRALREIKKVAPALIILDLKMPHVDGTEVLKRLKKMKMKQRPKIIMLTAHGSVDSAVSCLKLGANQFMEKPLDHTELLKKIREEIPCGDDGEQTLYVSVGAKIKKTRQQQKKTLQQLAAQTGLSMSLISQVENGKLAPSLSTLLKISNALQLSFKNLF